MANILTTTTGFLRDPSKPRAGFAALFAAGAERRAKEQGKVFNKVTNKFELPGKPKAKAKAKPVAAKTGSISTASIQTTALKRPKARGAKILASRSPSSARSASLLSNKKELDRLGS